MKHLAILTLLFMLLAPQAAFAQNGCADIRAVLQSARENGVEHVVLAGPVMEDFVAEIIEIAGPPPPGAAFDQVYLFHRVTPTTGRHVTFGFFVTVATSQTCQQIQLAGDQAKALWMRYHPLALAI